MKVKIIRIKTRSKIKMQISKQQNGQKLKGFYYAHGRRKEAAARVRLFTGKGQTLVNEKPIEVYFPLSVNKSLYLRPFQLTHTEGKYFATIKVKGSGKKGQLDAVIHGIARALTNADNEYRSTLKKAGLLTRDPRVKERRKYGLAQKARKGKQSPKR